MRDEKYQDQRSQSHIDSLFDVFECGANVFHHEYGVITFRLELRRERLNGPALVLRLGKIIETWLPKSFLADPISILGAIKVHVSICLKEHVDDFDVPCQSNIHKRQQESDLQGVDAPIDGVQGERAVHGELVVLTQRNSQCNLKRLRSQFSLILTLSTTQASSRQLNRWYELLNIYLIAQSALGS